MAWLVDYEDGSRDVILPVWFALPRPWNLIAVDKGAKQKATSEYCKTMSFAMCSSFRHAA